MERSAGPVETHCTCCEHILRTHLHEGIPPAPPVRLEHIAAAVGSHHRSESHTIVVVYLKLSEAVVVLEQCSLTRVYVDPVQVVVLGVAVVQPDNYLVWMIRTDSNDLCLNILQWREVVRLPVIRVPRRRRASSRLLLCPEGKLRGGWYRPRSRA